MRTLLLHNPVAGAGDWDRFRFEALFASHGHQVVYETTALDAVRRVWNGDWDLIAIAGGDGTIGHVLVGAGPTTAPITLLPLGTANNIAAAFGFDAPISDLVAGLAGARERAFALGRSTEGGVERAFVESAGVGTLAQALGPLNARRLPSARKLPEGLRALRQVVADAAPRSAVLTLDGQTEQLDLLLFEAVRIPRVGPRLCLAPGTDPGAATMQVVTATADDRAALLAWLDDDDRSRPAPVRVQVARRAALTWSGAPLHVDDTFLEPALTPGTLALDVMQSTFRILVPQVPPRSAEPTARPATATAPQAADVA